jgi:hypothetical protein
VHISLRRLLRRPSYGIPPYTNYPEPPMTATARLDLRRTTPMADSACRGQL